MSGAEPETRAGAGAAPGPGATTAFARIARERSALAAHRATLRGSTLAPPHEAPKGTFLHGFFLPFSLVAAMLRDGELRGPYLRVAAIRGAIVLAVALIAITDGDVSSRGKKETRSPSAGVVIHKKKPGESGKPVHVDVPGLRVDIDESGETASISVLGQNVPVHHTDDAPGTADDAPAAAPVPPSEAPAAAGAAAPGLARRVWSGARSSWAWLLALVTILSATEGVVVFFSRRWDDWLSFHGARLAGTRPEDDAAKTPKLAVDLRWLYRKMRRRLRGYVVFAAGVPALLPLRLLPVVGPWLFSIVVTMWGWYWLGVFSAAKSAHAWADEEQAPSPAPIRTLERTVAKGFVLAPVRWYGRLWAKITRSVNPAAATFERSPAAFLGLALARVILSAPGLYLLARPIVPIAAGRLCAEADPLDRFSAVTQARP